VIKLLGRPHASSRHPLGKSKLNDQSYGEQMAPADSDSGGIRPQHHPTLDNWQDPSGGKVGQRALSCVRYLLLDHDDAWLTLKGRYTTSARQHSLLRKDLNASRDAFVADRYARSGDYLALVVLSPPAKRACAEVAGLPPSYGLPGFG
jgi:hypothetical protein